ncbi:MAG: hypothetical protein ACOCP4_05205 [Candidatus Woesearchaeota archaeon]
MDDSTTVKIIDLAFDYAEPSVNIVSDWYFLLGLVLLLVIAYFIRRKLKENNFPIVEMDVEISGTPRTKFKAKRDDSNIYIANRIYIELITRKAAIPFDEKEDVIYEVYNSWYKLFGIIRDEIKNVPGHFLRTHKSTNALIGLTTKILNEGLRPHLTRYQAKFRKWYEAELDKNSSIGKTPQQIQSEYEYYTELVEDMKRVNKILIDYAAELKKLIEGKY